MASNEPKAASRQNRGLDNRMARISRRSVGKWAIITGVGSVILACSSSNDQGSTGANVGGGGAGTSVGGGAGTKATGGSGTQAAGASTTGGSPTAGGQGGNTAQATGGTTTVTPATGGASTGGTPANTGGAATGGAATGGNSATAAGGSATGGAATGGAATGGQTSAGTGGAATGGAATGGTSSCAAATITMVSASDYQIKSCDVTLDVNPQIGARVTSLKLGTASIISPFTCTTYDGNSTSCNNNAGSTFWTSPQNAWDGTVGGANGWPPVAAVDGNAYTPAITSNHLVLTGSADATLGASVTKDLSADSTTGWITITYTIKATKSIQVAPWQITRVPRGGLVFFPLVSVISNSNSLTTWTLSPSGSNEWIDDKNQTSVTSSGPKIIADGGGISGQSYTWLAYALGGNLLLIKYPDVQATAFAPSEGDTEVYPGSGYIELEAQGAYGPLAANGTMPWTVQWRVVAIPITVTVAAGSTTLATFAQQQAAM